MDSVGHVSDGDFVLRPVRKERLEEMSADFPMQATHAIDRPATADREIRHVETLGRVVRVLATKRQQIVERYAEPLLRITTEILLDQSRGETVKARSHGRVRSKDDCPLASRLARPRRAARFLP